MSLKRKRQAELERKRALRAFRQFTARFVVDEYLEDKPYLHSDEILDAFIIEQVGSSTKRGTGILRKLLVSNVNQATKDGMKWAIQDGVPGVLVKESYFDLSDDEREEMLSVDEFASRHVAGRGQGGEAAGIHFVQGDSDDALWRAQFNHRVATTNGVVNRVKGEAEVGNSKQLPGFRGNGNVMRVVRGMQELPLLEGIKEQ